MRILIANDVAAGGGGVESYLAALMPALDARRHQLAFLHVNRRSEQGPTRLALAGMPDISVTDDGMDGAIGQVRNWRPDVCFSHNMRELEVDEALTAQWPVVKMMHGYFGTCISGQKAHAFPRIVPCSRTFGAPCLALYLPRRCGQLRPLRMIEQYDWATRQRRMLDRYAHVVVAGAHMAREYSRHGVGGERLTTAPLFPTAATSEPARPMPAAPTVAFAGRMTSLKGGDVLIRAIAIASRRLAVPLRVVFAGEGPRRRAWEDLARELRVPAVFTGWVSGDERIAVFRGASVIAVPSLWPEPFGLGGLEAAVHGVPAVAFDVGGIGGWLHDGVNGRLVRDLGSPQALGATIASMFATPGEIARLGDGARAAACGFGRDAHVDILEGVFARAIERPVALA